MKEKESDHSGKLFKEFSIKLLIKADKNIKIEHILNISYSEPKHT